MSERGANRSIDTGTEDLLGRVEEGVAILTMNRPEARNALSGPMMQSLARVFPELGEDPGIGCVLLTGAGGAFCAGGDVKGMAKRGGGVGGAGQEAGMATAESSFEANVQTLRASQIGIIGGICELRKPVIAALPGPAAGAGMSIALACDLRIAAESAFFTTAFAKVAYSGDFGGSWLLTRLVGTGKARELYFTADRIGAKEAERLGIVNRVVADAALESESMALARRIAGGPTIAYKYMKENLNRALEQGLRACMDVEAEQMVRTGQTEDHREAVKAFVDKREPTFKGR
jgi:2-(1,2-epoxy-1,2-dihydrophenyl)acetyl-CoA isomerase